MLTESTVQTSDASNTSFKRPPSPSLNTPTNKKVKGILKNSSQPVAQAKSNLPADFFDSNLKQVNGGPSSAMQKSERKDLAANITNAQSMEVEEEKEKEKEKETETEKEKEKIGKDTNVSVLPEGFFDDPVMDAKVR